ncbi:proteoglycan 4 isoform X2 [Chrysoperla carnea]|uniref:proteoglycan 4 isoform X2 n=1 Tax=Chrysoperla carnea TaxID=189513 RepID=UPI001D086AD6|nr:proteoglycan 4 isoform X2 [Chrysoperla carnea]
MMSSTATPISIDEDYPEHVAHHTNDEESTQQQESGLCACSNILIMQLFHELKAKFPTVPDDVVRQCTDKYYHDRDTCISVLNAEQERIPRGLPYPPGLQQQSLAIPRPRPPSTCTNCCSHKNVGNLKRDKCLNNNIDKLLVETKDKLHKVNLESDLNANNKQSVKKMKNSKFYLTENNNNIDTSPPSADERRSSSEDLLNNNTKNIKNKKFNGIKSKVGKYAGRLSKKLDFTKHKTVSDNNPEIRTHSPVDSEDQNRISDNRFSGGDLSVNLNSGTVGFTIRKDPSNLNCDSKVKSQSMDCLSVPKSDDLKEKTASLQDINTEERLTNHHHQTSLEENTFDGDTIEMILPKSPFSLTKSTRVTNFKPGEKTKPPLPAKPITPKKPDRKKVSKEVPQTENETESTPAKNLNQKPPLPKRPTTLPVLPTASQVPPPLPPTNPTSPYTPSPTSVNVSLNVNVDVIPPSPTQRTVLNVNPELGWLPEQSPRSFTSVNLTLRTPTSEPQAPIDIGSSNAGLTYSSSSFDPRKGFQSSVQITVGPAGRTVSAIRARPRSSYTPDNEQSPIELSPRAGSLPDIITPSISNLIKRQLERKERLRLELIAEKRKLALMQQEVNSLEALPQPVLTNTSALSEDIRIRREIRHLQMQCKQLADEVDRRSYSRAPLGETSEEFYQNIYTGQHFILSAAAASRNAQRQPSFNNNRISDPQEGGPPWTCHMCTFSNHPLLSICEQCGMIRRIRRVTASPGDNIQIHVRPGPNRRILRSWVV